MIYEFLIRVQDISEKEPRVYKGFVPFEDMEELVDILGDQSHEARFEIQVSKTQSVLFMKGKIEGNLYLSCDRCLKSYSISLDENFDIILSPEVDQKILIKDQMLSGGDLETSFYSGEEVNLLELIEEQIVLGLPMKKVCSEGCAGICPQCGKDLNTGTCDCSESDTEDHPFAVLKKRSAAQRNVAQRNAAQQSATHLK